MSKSMFFGVTLLMLLSACARPHVYDLIHQNQVNLHKLSIGMTKTQAMETMGTQSADTRRGPVANPMRTEAVQSGGGVQYEVLHYMTRWTRGDAATTPLVFRDGRLVGWGHEALRQVQR